MVLTLTLQMGKQGPEMLGDCLRITQQVRVEPFRPGYTVPAVLLGCDLLTQTRVGLE